MIGLLAFTFFISTINNFSTAADDDNDSYSSGVNILTLSQAGRRDGEVFGYTKTFILEPIYAIACLLWLLFSLKRVPLLVVRPMKYGLVNIRAPPRLHLSY